MFSTLGNNLKQILLFLILLTLMSLGIWLLMMILLVLFAIIPIDLALLKLFSNLKNLTRFRLESTKTQKIEHFISLFTIVCVALTWLTIIGADYVKNKHHYHLKIRDTRRHKNNTTSRFISFFNLGLIIFNLCCYNTVNFTLKFDFVLYDV